MKNPVGRFVFSYPEDFGLVSGFEYLYVVTWSKKKLVPTYTVLNFPRNYSLVSVVKLV